MTAHEAEDGRDMEDNGILSLHFAAVKTEAQEGGLVKPGIPRLSLGGLSYSMALHHYIHGLSTSENSYREISVLHASSPAYAYCFQLLKLVLLIVSGSNSH